MHFYSQAHVCLALVTSRLEGSLVLLPGKVKGVRLEATVHMVGSLLLWLEIGVVLAITTIALVDLLLNTA